MILGEGPSWCAGVEVADHKPEMVSEMIAVFNGIFERIDKIEVPVIAGVHGACLGGGMEVAIACDIVVAAKSATFGQPEIKLGFFPPYAAVRLPQLVGPARAIEVCTTGKRYSAEEAQQMGFVAYVAEDDKFTETVDQLISEIRTSSPLIIRLNKRAVKKHLGLKFHRRPGRRQRPLPQRADENRRHAGRHPQLRRKTPTGVEEQLKTKYAQLRVPGFESQRWPQFSRIIFSGLNDKTRNA